MRHLIALLLVPACTPLTTEPAVRAVTRDAGFTKQAPLVSQWRELGRSVEARPIRARTVGHGPRHVLWIGGIHGDETEGTLATAALPADFLAAGLAERVTLTIVEDVNPDGRAAKRRGNAHGVDVNRNFPARTFTPSGSRGSEPLSEPEARILHDLILASPPDLVIVCHAWRGRHFINFDGPARELAQTFATLSGYPLVASEEFDPTPGSLGSWVGGDLGHAILTIEWLKGRPWDEAWEDIRLAALAVIEGR